MADQPAYRPFVPSAFFADGQSARPLVPGTLPRGHLQKDPHLDTGRLAEAAEPARAAAVVGALSGTLGGAVAAAAAPPRYADTFPFPVTRAVLERGQERYQIYCAVCHDRLGTGKGPIVQRGFTPPPSLQDDLSRGLRFQGLEVPLREAPVGYYFEVITRGYGAMPDYAAEVAAHDRWAIIAYIRALQLSQHATLADVPPSARPQLEIGGLP
jgi:mono/diheme cytochrome c family protein